MTKKKKMTPRERQHRFRIAVSFLLVYFFWGSTYLAIRIAVEHLPAATLGAVRFLIAGVVMLAYCALSGRKISLSWADAGKLLLIGVLLLTGGNVLLAYSEKYVPSGLAALIVAIVPLWVALIEGFVLKNGDRLNARGWIGLTLGVGGLVVLLWPQLSPLILGGGRALDRPFLVATVAVLLGWMLAGERVDRYIGIGAVVIVAAVALVTSSKLRRTAEPARQILPACEAEA